MGNKKITGLQRIHCYVDERTIADLDFLVRQEIRSSRSRVVRNLIAEAVAARMKTGTAKQRGRRMALR